MEDLSMIAAVAAMTILIKRNKREPEQSNTPTAEDYRRMAAKAEKEREETQRLHEEMERSPRAFKRRLAKLQQRNTHDKR